ncbi:MAG: hypothetical protein V1739_09135 [Candidatus Omnitrophota bacterium]
MIKKTNLLILLLLSLQLSGCGREPDDQKINALKKQTKVLKQKINLLENKISEKEFSAGRFINEAKLYIAVGDKAKAKNFIDLLFEKFPDSKEAEIGKELMFEMEDISADQLTRDSELVYDFNRQKIIKYHQNYLGLMLGSGGEADGESLSFELAQRRKDYIFGMGGTWLATNDVDKTYYVSGSSSSLNSDLGYNNNGDEIEIYGLWGKRLKEKLFFACTGGFSQQEMVHLEKSSSSSAIYATSTKKENYVTYSLQLRHILDNKNMLVIGYHNRRGFMAGISLKL